MPGVVDHEAEPLGRVRRVERHVRGAELERGEHADDHVDAAGHGDADAVAAADAGGRRAGRRARPTAASSSRVGRACGPRADSAGASGVPATWARNSASIVAVRSWSSAVRVEGVEERPARRRRAIGRSPTGVAAVAAPAAQQRAPAGRRCGRGRRVGRRRAAASRRIGCRRRRDDAQYGVAERRVGGVALRRARRRPGAASGVATRARVAADGVAQQRVARRRRTLELGRGGRAQRRRTCVVEVDVEHGDRRHGERSEPSSRSRTRRMRR